jgi:hypothetical protein
MKTKMKRLPQYAHNLAIVNDTEVFSYDTCVATLDHEKREVVLDGEYYSRTTTKHINYVATYYGYTIIKGDAV